MIDLVPVYRRKAEESLAGAESEFANSRYNNCANRCYYACFQVAISALVSEGIQPPIQQGQWGHSFVQSEFVGHLIKRRKVFPTGLRDVLVRNLELRVTADYRQAQITRIQAQRALQRARDLIATVRERQGENQ